MKKSGKVLFGVLSVSALVGTGFASWIVNNYPSSSKFIDADSTVDSTVEYKYNLVTLNIENIDNSVIFGPNDDLSLSYLLKGNDTDYDRDYSLVTNEYIPDIDVTLNLTRNDLPLTNEELNKVKEYLVLPSDQTISYTEWLNPSLKGKGYEFNPTFKWNTDELGTNPQLFVEGLPANEQKAYFEGLVNALKDVKYTFKFSVGRVSTNFAITLDESIKNGVVTIEDALGNSIKNGQSVKENTTLYINATPNEFYTLENVYLDNEILPLKEGKYEFKVTKAHVINATFKQLTSKITVTENEAITNVLLNGATLNESYPLGSDVTLSFDLNERYNLVNVTLDGEVLNKTQEAYTFKVTKENHVIAFNTKLKEATKLVVSSNLPSSIKVNEEVEVLLKNDLNEDVTNFTLKIVPEGTTGEIKLVQNKLVGVKAGVINFKLETTTLSTDLLTIEVKAVATKLVLETVLPETINVGEKLPLSIKNDLNEEVLGYTLKVTSDSTGGEVQLVDNQLVGVKPGLVTFSFVKDTLETEEQIIEVKAVATKLLVEMDATTVNVNKTISYLVSDDLSNLIETGYTVEGLDATEETIIDVSTLGEIKGLKAGVATFNIKYNNLVSDEITVTVISNASDILDAKSHLDGENVKVYGKHDGSFGKTSYFVDGDKSIIVNNYAEASSLVKGKNYIIEGTVDVYNGLYQIANATIVEDVDNLYNPQESVVKEVLDPTTLNGTNGGDLVKISGKLDSQFALSQITKLVNGDKTFNVRLSGSGENKELADTLTKIKVGTEVSLNVHVSFYNSKSTTIPTDSTGLQFQHVTSFEYVDALEANLSATSVKQGETTTLKVTNALNEEIKDFELINLDSALTFDKVTGTLTVSETAEVKEYVVTVRYNSLETTFTLNVLDKGAVIQTEERNYNYTFTSGKISKTEQDVTLGNLTWHQTKAVYVGFDSSSNSKGVQIGSKGTPQTSPFVLSIDLPEGVRLKSYSLELSVGSSGNASYTVSTQKTSEAEANFTNTEAFKNTTPQAYEGTNTNYLVSGEGKLSISLKATTKALYIKSMSFVFDAVTTSDFLK